MAARSRAAACQPEAPSRLSCSRARALLDRRQLEMNSGFFVRPGGAVFLSRPGSGGYRAQRRSRVTAGHRAAARDAPLTASSTARRLAKPGAIVARDPLHPQVTIVIALGCTGDRVAKSRDRGCKPGRAALSVAPRLRHPCAGLTIDTFRTDCLSATLLGTKVGLKKRSNQPMQIYGRVSEIVP